MRGLFLCFCLVWVGLSFSATPEEKGLEIAKKMQAANNGFIGEESLMEMVLIDAYGAKTTRLMKGMVMEVTDDGDKSISIFQNPKDVKGTKMLTHTHKSDDDDQWLYLPTVRRVKRISSSNKSSSFMGSEFSYEDLGSQEIEKYNYKWLSDIKIGDATGWKMERVPKTKSGYSKMIMYISSKYMNPVKVEYFDRKAELLKVAVFSNFKGFKAGGKSLWRSNKIHMKNVQTKKESIFEWKERSLGVKHKDIDFNKTALQR
ncbi:MAG: outer membrane lipoprotein-sorting protein [Bacteriovoracaceae bacterium]|nr:outer membrane lipoprotein-sorting protein [Bacteriovoracaceae bacterium]